MVIFCRHDKQCKRRNEDSLKISKYSKKKKKIFKMCLSHRIKI